MQTVIVNNFPGMVADPRNARGAQLTKHFDNFTKKGTLVPYKDSEDGAPATQANIQLKNFLVSNGALYGLGRQSAINKALIQKTTAIDIPSWSSPTNGQDGTYTVGANDNNLFVEYIDTSGVISFYGANSNGIWAYTESTTTFTAAAYGISHTNVAQGLVKASKLYIPLDNVIYVKNDGAVTANWSVGLTLPKNLIITSICERGNFIGITCRPLYTNSGTSKFFLWDRDTTLVEPNERIEWGAKDLYVAEEIDGYIIGVSIQNGLNSSTPAKLVFSRWNGGGELVFNEIEITFAGTLTVRKQKYNNRLYFIVTGTSIGGTTNDYTGVWSVGRGSQNEEFSVTFDRLAKNDTLVYQIFGFILVQGFMFISYLITNGGSDYELSKTNDQSSYAVTATHRTCINPGNMSEADKFKHKTVKFAALTYDPLPGTSSAYQVALKYKVDGSAFVTVFTKTDDAVVGTKIITEAGKDTNGDSLVGGRDVEFQIESKGVNVTGLIYGIETSISLINPKT